MNVNLPWIEIQSVSSSNIISEQLTIFWEIDLYIYVSNFASNGVLIYIVLQ